MTQHSPIESPLDKERARVEELQQRIEQLEGQDESAFGRFSAWDWLICVLGGIAAPAVAAWWFAG